MFLLFAARIPRGEPKEDVIDVMLKHKIAFRLLPCSDDLAVIQKIYNDNGGLNTPSTYNDQILSNANPLHGVQNSQGLIPEQIGREAEPEPEVKVEFKEECDETPSDQAPLHHSPDPPVDHEAPRDDEFAGKSALEHEVKEEAASEVKEEVQEAPLTNQESINDFPASPVYHEMPGGIGEEVTRIPAAEHEIKEEIQDPPVSMLVPLRAISAPPSSHEEPHDIFEGVKMEPFDGSLLNSDERDVDLAMDTDDMANNVDSSGDHMNASDVGDISENTVVSPEGDKIRYNTAQDAFATNYNPFRSDGNAEEVDSHHIFIDSDLMDVNEPEPNDGVLQPHSVMQLSPIYTPFSPFGHDEPQGIVDDFNLELDNMPRIDPEEKNVDSMMDDEEMEEDLSGLEKHELHDGEQVHEAPPRAPASPTNDEMLEVVSKRMKHDHVGKYNTNDSDVGLMSDSDELEEGCSDTEEQADPEKQANDDEERTVMGADDLVEDCSDAEGQPDPEEEATDDEEHTVKDASSKKKRHQCDVCNKIFDCVTKLSLHYRTHTGGKSFKCNICNSEFSHISYRAIHMRSHTGEKPFVCKVCKQSFAVSGALTRHSRIHTGEKPFECEVCHAKFSMRSSLKYHISTHTGEKPYSCDVCDKSFVRSSDYKRHYRYHTKEKPYKCEVCEKEFSHRGSLNVHMRSHTGEKPYECKDCQKKFTNSSNLRQHTRLHHT